MTDQESKPYRVVIAAGGDTSQDADTVPFVIDEMFGYAAMVTARRIQRVLGARFEKYGVLFGEWPILLFLWAKGTASQNDLSKLVSIGEGTIARSVSRMEKKGLVKRERNSQDRREYIVQPTEKGLGLRDTLLAEANDLTKAIRAAMGADELDQLTETHRQLNEVLQEIEARDQNA
jgi:DNA-binding MarR family transcriptional regulator|tara:strand:+ start:2208 stop:2735 length:528 start_codon:yes stop_codon:yes gene_type:complete